MPSKTPGLQVSINGKRYYIHRLIWEAVNGSIPIGHVIHHIDGNSRNNDIANLQCMPHADHVRLHREQDGIAPPSNVGRKHKVAPIVCAECGITALRAPAKNPNPDGHHYCSKACNAKAYRRRKAA